MHDSKADTTDDEALAPDGRTTGPRDPALTPLRRTTSMHALPSTAHDLIEVIGLQATIDLVAVCGGAELDVPARSDTDSRGWAALEDGIGADAARKLVSSRFGGTPVYIPMCTAALRAERDRQIVALLVRGEHVDAVRRKFQLSKSYVYRVFKRVMAA